MSVKIVLPAGWSKHPDLLLKGFHNGVNRVTVMLTNAAITNAPRKTGNLKRSIHAEVSPAAAQFTGKVIQDKGVAKYGLFVETGTGLFGPKKEPIKPKTKSFLQWKTPDGRFIRKKSVKGMRARPFMRPAFNEHRGQIGDIITEEIKKAFAGVK